MGATALDKIYQQIAQKQGEQWQNWRLLFQLQDIFMGVMEFDPAKDEVLPITVDDVLYRMGQDYGGKEVWWNDRLQHIVDFAVPAIRHILESLKRKNIREHRVVRPEKVRETDSTCMRWLSIQPGYTLRQKIASRQRMMGVFHDTSIDTTENRLFKALLERLHMLLLEKEVCCKELRIEIPPETIRFISTVRWWLREEEARQIRPWNHLPPNNTLLGHKHYRKIWKAWNDLQKLDEDNQRDFNHLDTIKTETLLWLVAGRLNRNNAIRFLQDTIYPDNKNLSIGGDNTRIVGGLVAGGSWKPLKLYSCAISSYCMEKACGGIDSIKGLHEAAEVTVGRIRTYIFPGMDFSQQEQPPRPEADMAAVDLCSILPAYTSECKNGGRTSGRFTQRLLYQEHEGQGYSCRHSKFILAERPTHSIHSILNGKSKDTLEKPSSDFCRTMSSQLQCKTCLYIVQDDMDDFSRAVSTFKRSMSLAFVRTEILPRSIAAVFSRLKEIQDWYLSSPDNARKTKRIVVMDIRDDRNLIIELDIVGGQEGLAERNPETRGLVFRRLDVKVEARDEAMPPQSMKGVLTGNDAALLSGQFSVRKENDVHHFGEAAACNQKEDLPDSGKYTIFLSEADDVSAGGLEYHRLQEKTPDIPLWTVRLPKLAMQDSSGKEFVLVEPDKVFVQPTGKPEAIPVAKEFILGAKKKFYEFPLIQGEEGKGDKYFAFIEDSVLPLGTKTDCILHLTYTYGKPIPYELEFRPKDPSAGFRILKVEWKDSSNKDGVRNMPYPDFVREYKWKDMTSVPSKEPDNPPRNITGQWLPDQYDYLRSYKKERYETSKKSRFIKSLRFPALTAWNNGRSISDADCPPEFKERTLEILDFIRGNKIYDIDSTTYLHKNDAREWCFFLSCMHKDTLKEFSDLLCGTYFDHLGDKEYEKTEKEHFQIQKWIAYALGDCSQPWQKDLFRKTVCLLDGEKSEYGVKILAIALWRVRDFIGRFGLEETKKLLEACLAGIQTDESAYLAASLECALALCRLRNHDRKPGIEILEALSKNNPVVRDLVSALENLKERGGQELKTFLKLEEGEGQETDNGRLLFEAALGYLSGSLDDDSITVIDTDFLP